MSSQPSTTILGETLGALYVGAIIAAILFGLTNLQAVIYFKKYPYDWWVYRYSVALLWVLDALQVAWTTHGLYFYLIDMFGDLSGVLSHSVWSFKLQIGANIFLVIFVQMLYAIRLWKLGRHFHKILPWFVFLAVAASLGTGIFMVYAIYKAPNFSNISSTQAAIYAVFVTVAISDFVIALMMCYYLQKSRAATNFSTTASLLLNLMRLVVVSGLATSACSLLTLILYIAWPKTLIFLGMDFVLPKLYVNSLLAMFNYRHEQSVSKMPNAGHTRGLPMPAIFRITPHTSENSTAETTLSIPLSEVQLNHSKSNLDDQV
ncbi:hypothetical protein ARMSODRAFT_954945 [Armillaria solidipes]|uniref:DUF6534 domain-containing protein n=1 Tax=Armillaria solidipes TaxID=1076256 RepID=A0A2H3BYQ4_9AGAR|nr:hypothetical protein ARMSODRAFT_954945 [Armillaria solidipes]